MAASELHLRSLELSRAIHRVTDAILRGENAAGVLQNVVDITGPALAADRASIYDVRLDAGVAVGLCEWLRPGAELFSILAAYPVGHFAAVLSQMARSDAPFESSHARPHPLLPREAVEEVHERLAVRRLLGFPLQRRSDGYYVLLVNQVTGDRPWTPEELEFVEAVARQVNLALMKLDLLRERDRVNEELRQGETRLRLLYDQTPSMFFTVDRNQIVRSMNRFASEHLGYTAGELLGKSVMGIVHPQDRDEVARHVAACFAEPGTVRTLSFRKVRKGGDVIWVKETARVVEGPDGANALIACEDVTASRALEEAARLAESQSHGKDEFMAMLGHELRNPLAPIVTALEILGRRGRDDPELQVIHRQVTHLRRLVDDLLDVSRIIRGKVELHLERVQLSTVFSQAMEIARPFFWRKQQKVATSIEPPGLAVNADPSRLVQVFGNLLTNASKFSGERTNVSFTAEERDGKVLVRVRDEGEGIDPDMLERVFELFVQRPQAADRASSGLGLGLTIARNLIVLHGGTLRALSKGRGMGTTLEVELPAATEPVAATSRASDGVAASPVAASLVGKILVVDDNKDARELLCAGLELLGYDVESAVDGPSALSTANRRAPRVALVDIGLPGMDGYELAQRLRSEHAELKLVAVTGYGQASDRLRTQAAGFDAHLVKPVELEALRQLLEGMRSRPI